MSGTTSIDDLPISPQTDGNIKIDLQEKNIMINNAAKDLNNVRNEMGANGNGMGANGMGTNAQAQAQAGSASIGTTDINSFINGIQKASASGVLSLPTRDIPQYQNHITQDNQTQANYVPKGPDDYIKEHQTPEDIIQKNLKREESENTLDEYYNEIHIPLMIGVLYFIFHLPVVRKNIFKYIPALFNADGNLNGTGYIANSLMFSGLCYVTFRSINYMSV
jgi:hypothetical protein